MKITLINLDGSINEKVVRKNNLYHVSIFKAVKGKDLDNLEDIKKMVVSFISITMLNVNFQLKFSNEELEEFQEFFKDHLMLKRFDQKLLFREFRNLLKKHY